MARLREGVLNRPRAVLATAAALTALSLVASLRWLEFQPGRDKLIGEDQDYHQAFLRIREEFGGQDRMVVVLEGEATEQVAFASALEERLLERPDVFGAAFYGVDPSQLTGQLLTLAPDEAIDELALSLSRARPLLRAAERGGFAELESAVAEEIRRALSEPRRGDSAPGLERLGLLKELLRGCALAARGDPSAVPELGGSSSAWSGARYNRSPDGRFLFVFVEPLAQAGRIDASGDAVDALRAVLAELRPLHPGLEVGLTGKPVLTVDEMATYQRDATRASALSLLGVTALFVFAFRGVRAPLLAAATLLVAIAWTFGFAAVVLGHLNLLSIVFAVVLIGLGIDFGIHMVARCEEELRRRQGPWRETIDRAMASTGRAIWTAAVTTAIAFFAAWFTEFQGMRELGLIAGAGVLFCALAAWTVLPAALLLAGPGVCDGEASREAEGGARSWTPPSAKCAKPVLGVALLLTAAAAVGATGLRFDFNLLHMQADGLPSVEWERRVLESAGSTGLSAQVMVESLEEARAMASKLRALPTVQEVHSLSDLLRVDPEARLRRLRSLLAELPEPRLGSREASESPTPREEERITTSLAELIGVLEEAQELAVRGGQDALAEGLDACISFGEEALTGAAKPAGRKALGEYGGRVMAALRRAIARLRIELDAPALSLSNLPLVLRRRYVGKTGKLLLIVRPRGDSWDEAALRRFRDDLRSAAGMAAAGVPIQIYETMTRMRAGYKRAGVYALIAVFCVLLIDLRSFTAALLGLLPTLIAAIWLCGGLRLLGIDINPANLMALPIIFGAGIDGTVHITHRFREGQRGEILPGGTGKAVVLSALTTMIGFGALGVAHHRGLASLGVVLLLGIGACLLASVSVLPALLTTRVGRAILLRRSEPTSGQERA